jgi:hypothetical protein
MTRIIPAGAHLRQRGGSKGARFGGRGPTCPKINRRPQDLRQKRHSGRAATRDKHLSSGTIVDFDDNAANSIMAFSAQSRVRERETFDWNAQCRR